MPNNQNKKKNQPNSWLFFTGLGLQIGVTVYVMAYLGDILDKKYQTPKPYFAFGLVIIGLVASIYSAVKQLNKINHD